MAADTVQQVKDKLSIVDVITPYVKLTKSGRYHKGLSPFTKEKTPSFFVNPERGSYYCFSTSQGGDMFTFIEKMEGVDFKGALKILADKAGVEVVYEGGHGKDAKKDAREKLREVMARAEATYRDANNEMSPAYVYSIGRGLSKETISSWGLGYAPDAWRILLETMTAEGKFTQNDLLAAGLIKEADGKPGTWYDRFRNRLMFPIRDVAGRTVGFTGRALSPDDTAKYLNSPETDLYKKSEVMFGMDKAKDAIRTRGFAILVEGQFDLVLLHQAGFTNTIALSGTALSAQHLTLIKRYADNLMLALDSDRAGLAATAKNARAALMAGLRVKAIRIPVGKDPADIVSEEGGAKAFTKLLTDAQSVVEFFLSTFAASEPDQFKLLQAVEKIVLPLVASVESPLEREHFIGVVARSLSTTPDAVRASLARVVRAEGVQGGAQSKPQTSQQQASVARPLSVPKLSEREKRARELQALAASYPDSLLARRLKTEYSRIIGAPDTHDGEDPFSGEVSDERALFEAGLTFGESPSENAADDLLLMFERAVLSEQLQDVKRRLGVAEANNDQETAQACLLEYQTLSHTLTSL